MWQCRYTLVSSLHLSADIMKFGFLRCNWNPIHMEFCSQQMLWVKFHMKSYVKFPVKVSIWKFNMKLHMECLMTFHRKFREVKRIRLQSLFKCLSSTLHVNLPIWRIRLMIGTNKAMKFCSIRCITSYIFDRIAAYVTPIHSTRPPSVARDVQVNRSKVLLTSQQYFGIFKGTWNLSRQITDLVANFF